MCCIFQTILLQDALEQLLYEGMACIHHQQGTLELIKTPDILTEVKGNFLKVGFAAESEDVEANAKQKLEKKQLDLIAANDITATDSGFGVDTNRVTLIDRNGNVESLPLMSKREVADKILDKVVGLLSERKKR